MFEKTIETICDITKMNSTNLSFLIILSFAMVHSLQEEKDPIVNYSALENPFRSQKCNLLWDKARYFFLNIIVDLF